MKKVDCEFCGAIFLMAQAVVLSDRGEFHYYCSKGCAMKGKGMETPRPKEKVKALT